MNEIGVFLLFITNIVVISGENILGCGGFVKSHVPIDFSKVEVKLLTKQGILKDKINCAPTNGYYFVPLYDKGEYILELEPPPGWSFTPTKVDLNVDGLNDLCSKGRDINFNFKGFGITGKVESLGNVNGPEGVEIHLKTGSDVRKTLTNTGGSFFFTPVYPGKYTVKIVNSKWKALRESVEVHVTEGNTELPSRSLVIQGYDVSGSVKDEGEPIKDATIVLFSENGIDVQVDGCYKSPLPGFKGAKPLCHVKTNEKGTFKFGTVPSGKYFVSLYYNEQNIYFQPNNIKFSVEQDSVQLKEYFEIIGFSISGRVMRVPGKPLPNAKVFLDGKEIARTDKNGIYQLDKLKAGTYILEAVADNCLFKQLSMRITPNSVLPDLMPASFKMCGSIVSTKAHHIRFARVGSTYILSSLSDANTGIFCEFLDPGTYDVQVLVGPADAQKGMQFYPKVHRVVVEAEQSDKIVFSQLKATVTGKVQCIHKKDCIGLKAILKPVGDGNEVIISVSDNSYKISDIYPGTYEVSLSANSLCWKADKHKVNVNNIQVEIPTFTQVGYSVVFVSSHDTQVHFNKDVIKINKGKLRYCLEKPGVYEFHLNSCHSYESNIVSYDTNSLGNEVFLNAIKHTITLFVESEQKHGNVNATINIDGKKTSHMLPFKQNGYEIKLSLSPSETAVIVPQSEILYFNPPILLITGSNDCQKLGPKFQALLGIVFKGKVIPPLQGVLVTVETDDSDSLLAETDVNGIYKFPPLDESKNYKITAKKDSYVLVGPNTDGDFLAQKLAEIIIQVVDRSDNAPLQGALLSLSGGDSYRSNLQTNDAGIITFNFLSPGEYFMRPMMKEYSFEPTSKIIKVNEGQTVNVKLSGIRVAYSAYGQVASLNREPEENAVVVATGVANCSHYSEESTSEVSGHFRIRGLQPYCSYDIGVKSGMEPIERSAPRSVHVEHVKQDVTGLELIIFRPIPQIDLLVKVFAKNPEHYKSLRLKVVSEATTNVVYTGRVDVSSISINADSNQGVFIQIPPIPFNGKTYSVHLESNLNNKLEPEPEYFVADASFKYVELDFSVKNNTIEQDIKQTPIWTLILIFIIMLMVYNIDKVGPVLQDILGGVINDLWNLIGTRSATTDYTVDNDDIDQIVQSINAVKKKPKPKRI